MDIHGYMSDVLTAASLGIAGDLIMGMLSEKNPGLQRYIKTGIALCVASCIVIPVTGKNISSFPDEDIFYGRYIEKEAEVGNSMYILEKECEGKICDEVFGVTGIKALDVCVCIAEEEGIPVVKSVIVTIGKENAEKCGVVEETVKKAVGISDGVQVITV